MLKGFERMVVEGEANAWKDWEAKGGIPPVDQFVGKTIYPAKTKFDEYGQIKY